MGMNATPDMFMDAYNLLLSDPGYGIKYGLGFLFTGLDMAQLQEDFPDATDLEIHTAYLNAEPGTFEQILEYAEEELSSGSIDYPVASWGDAPQSSSEGSGTSETSETTEETGTSETTSSSGGLLGH